MSDYVAPYGSTIQKIIDLLADVDPSIKATASIRDGRVAITMTEPEAVTLFKLLKSKLIVDSSSGPVEKRA